MKFNVWLIVLLAGMFLSGNEISAQQRPIFRQSQPVPVASSGNSLDNSKTMPTIYGHLFGGLGISYLSAKDIKDIVGDDWGVGIGLPTWSYGLRTGFRNILQVEYNIGKAKHNLNSTGYEAVPIDEPGYAKEKNEVVKMDYDTTDIQFKLNPKFWKNTTDVDGFTSAFFIVYGFGDVEWRDKVDDGFEGESTIYGIEYAKISKHATLSVSLKRYAIDFDETTLFEIPFPHKTNAADYIFEIKIGFGLGM